jgi:acylglycerol lipase
VHLVTRLFLAGLTVSVAAGALMRPRPRPKPRAESPRLDEDALVAGDGLRLPLARWSPEKPPKAVALGLHGYGDYRQAFRLAGPELADHGVELIAYDQRGFGETASRGEWPGSEGLIVDLAEAVGAVRRAFPGTPLVVIGESMGASVALAGLGQGVVRDVDALILAAPGVRGDIPMRQMHDLALRLGALALPWLAVELRRGARPWLDADEAERLADDPLILRRLSVGTYEGLVELATLASALPGAKLPPTLLLHGDLDRTIPRAAINELIARLAGGLSHKLYPDRHHLLLHERDAEEVVQDCLEWLSEVLPKAARKRRKG